MEHKFGGKDVHYRASEAKSKTGVIGVQYVKKMRYTKRNGKRYGPYLNEAYKALLPNRSSGRRRSRVRTRIFSVQKHGKEAAYLAACLARGCRKPPALNVL